MTARFPVEQFTQVRAATLTHRGEYGRAFDLHPALYAITFGGYIVYLAIMSLAFANRELGIPLAICFVSVIAGFGTPAIWARVSPGNAGERPRWATGAMVQVLIMPVLLIVWGISVVIIAACVR